MIVDDNVGYIAAARDLLEREEINVVGVASTIRDALWCFEELRPDVMLVDINLGDDCGFDLARRLADARHGEQPAIILISTYAEKDLADMIATSPAVAFIPKSRLSGSAIRGVLAGEDAAGERCGHAGRG
jgi:DNA-binding NarL/FixJ family response regulator